LPENKRVSVQNGLTVRGDQCQKKEERIKNRAPNLRTMGCIV